MATTSELFQIIDASLPDNGAEIDAAMVRAALYAIVAADHGQSFMPVSVSDGATSITNPALIGKTVTLMVGEAFSKTIGFTQPNSNGTIYFTDGTTLNAGTVTIFFE